MKLHKALEYFILNLCILLFMNPESYSLTNFSKGSCASYDPFLFDSSITNDGTHPSLPLSRIDIKNNFYWDWFELKDDRYYNIFQVNAGKTFYKGHLYFYLYLPLVTTNLTFETQTGAGDVSLNIQYSTNRRNKINLITGTELIFPTGSSFETGLGKYIAGPFSGFIEYYKSGYYGLIMTYYFSYAGQSDRDKISELSINPLFKIDLGKNWYTLITPDIVYTFSTGKFFIPYTQEFGKLFKNNFSASVKAGFHLKNDNRYDILAELKFSCFL